MARFIIALLLSAALISGQAVEQAFDGPEQAARGHRLFTTTAKPVACATCHAIGATSPTPGPDLKIWSRLAPRGTASAITTALTEKSVMVELNQGGAFPATKVSEDGMSIQFFDLSRKPPEMRTVAKSDIRQMKTNAIWKHPPGTEKYSTAELADLIAYIRWAGNRDKTPIAPESLQ
jgi:hypothetical protein